MLKEAPPPSPSTLNQWLAADKDNLEKECETKEKIQVGVMWPLPAPVVILWPLWKKPRSCKNQQGQPKMEADS